MTIQTWTMWRCNICGKTDRSERFGGEMMPIGWTEFPYETTDYFTGEKVQEPALAEHVCDNPECMKARVTENEE